MPLTVRVDAAQRVCYTVATGTVTDADVLDTYGGELANPAFDPALDQIFDGRAIDRVEVTSDALRTLADLVVDVDGALPPGIHPRVAIVVPTDVAFGLARMYQAYCESRGTPKQYYVCRSMDEAHRWMQLDETARESES
jgi:hypothetical protein